MSETRPLCRGQLGLIRRSGVHDPDGASEEDAFRRPPARPSVEIVTPIACVQVRQRFRSVRPKRLANARCISSSSALSTLRRCSATHAAIIARRRLNPCAAWVDKCSGTHISLHGEPPLRRSLLVTCSYTVFAVLRCPLHCFPGSQLTFEGRDMYGNQPRGECRLGFPSHTDSPPVTMR
jgi:hypothetical protein